MRGGKEGLGLGDFDRVWMTTRLELRCDGNWTEWNGKQKKKKKRNLDGLSARQIACVGFGKGF